MSQSSEIEIGWAILELMGHRKLAGHVSEVEVAGAKMLRLDVPAADGREPVTQFYSASAVYCLTPTTEPIARAAARNQWPVPVNRYELMSLPMPAGSVSSVFRTVDEAFPDDDDDSHP